MSTNTNTPKRPAYRLNYEIKGRDSKTARSIEIGAAWPHSDGKGFSLRFDVAPPPGGYVSMRPVVRQEAFLTTAPLP